ncbi:MAG: ferritin-like domain-containing protein [Bacteroidetes bacterium]|nr:ferritin-like domain-containing protein [Bacteroidota bacterium]
MANTKSSSNGRSSSTMSKSNSDKEQLEFSQGMQSSQLMKLFEEELKDIYWAEKALTKAIPKMIKNATSEDLIEALENHLTETEEQIKRVEQVFEIIGKKATAKKCEAMEGLIKEAEEIMEECEEGAMCDAGIISAGQKVEHYEIASYGTLRQFAETLGYEDAADLLQLTLDEEKAADEKLTEVAVATINVEASEEELGKKTSSTSKSKK